jgi:cyclopropane fatty-acyl-phospholipid synthase-like methyltransferase
VLASGGEHLVTSAARRWREALAAWAIPPEILAAAPESPWTFPIELFARRADASTQALTVSNRIALEGLSQGEGGSVLDVGCGAGAASLPLAPPADELIGVDTSAEMLEAFEQRARKAAPSVRTVLGGWPDVAADSPIVDVVVCNHVFYNAGELPSFALALTDHARRRAVVELTLTHPQSSLNNLWLRFHGIQRPTGPTADDAVAVLREAGLEPSREDWQAPLRGGFADRADLVAWVRRRLCLTADRDPEVADAIAERTVERDGLTNFAPQPVVTLSWPGIAR